MNRTFTPQEQQQPISTSMCDESAALDDSNIKESVANREEQQEIRNKRILIVNDEPDITFTLRTILECSILKLLTLRLMFLFPIQSP